MQKHSVEGKVVLKIWYANVHLVKMSRYSIPPKQSPSEAWNTIVFEFVQLFLLNSLSYTLLSSSAEDLGSLFEKRDFKDRPKSTGTKSTLSLRLEQCPQQLNNPFNEYSKFDGKVSCTSDLTLCVTTSCPCLDLRSLWPTCFFSTRAQSIDDVYVTVL